MKKKNNYLFIIYRLLTFSIFFSSFFLLLFNVLDKEKILYRIFIFLGLISSPILLYYGYNFLPDILGLSLLLVCFKESINNGFIFLNKALKNKSNNLFFIFTPTDYGSGNLLTVVPIKYNGACAVRTRAAGASYLMVGVTGAVLTAASALY